MIFGFFIAALSCASLGFIVGVSWGKNEAKVRE